LNDNPVMMMIMATTSYRDILLLSESVASILRLHSVSIKLQDQSKKEVNILFVVAFGRLQVMRHRAYLTVPAWIPVRTKTSKIGEKLVSCYPVFYDSSIADRQEAPIKLTTQHQR
jgi:hypothetical protein